MSCASRSVNLPVVSVHWDPSCAEIQKMEKQNQRSVVINTQSISTELQKFTATRYKFGATANLNDMWIKVDFADSDFERAVLAHVHRLIGKHYAPLASVSISKDHC